MSFCLLCLNPNIFLLKILWNSCFLLDRVSLCLYPIISLILWSYWWLPLTLDSPALHIWSIFLDFPCHVDSPGYHLCIISSDAVSGPGVQEWGCCVACYRPQLPTPPSCSNTQSPQSPQPQCPQCPQTEQHQHPPTQQTLTMRVSHLKNKYIVLVQYYNNNIWNDKIQYLKTENTFPEWHRIEDTGHHRKSTDTQTQVIWWLQKTKMCSDLPLVNCIIIIIYYY